MAFKKMAVALTLLALVAGAFAVDADVQKRVRRCVCSFGGLSVRSAGRVARNARHSLTCVACFAAVHRCLFPTPLPCPARCDARRTTVR
jgi:hypothetical protein